MNNLYVKSYLNEILKCFENVQGPGYNGVPSYCGDNVIKVNTSGLSSTQSGPSHVSFVGISTCDTDHVFLDIVKGEHEWYIIDCGYMRSMINGGNLPIQKCLDGDYNYDQNTLYANTVKYAVQEFITTYDKNSEHLKAHIQKNRKALQNYG